VSEWWMYEKPAKRRAADGIKARSRTGEIGQSWWSGRFLAALKEVADTSRLGRGRSYARSGQVLDLDVSPGLVSASVQGSRSKPYAVRIALKPFSDAEWARAEQALAEQALFLASLLAGEMPPDVEDAFAAAGLSLFPSRPGDLTTDCSCPDWANPCKHAAATYYILAEAFDDDPFLVLAWRGRAREPLLARLRELRGAAAPVRPSAAAPETRIAEPRSGGFWRPGPELAALRFTPRAAAVPDAVLRQLGPLPEAAGGQRVTDVLAAAYRIFTVHAERRAFAPAEPADVPTVSAGPAVAGVPGKPQPSTAPDVDVPPAAEGSPEEAILRHVDARGRITRGEAAALCGVAPLQASRLLKAMVERGELVLHGARRTAHYERPTGGRRRRGGDNRGR
jgi:uncharacterized Zn finger protein